MYIRWLVCMERDVVFLSPNNFQEFKTESGKINFHFGAWQETLDVRILPALDDNTIGLPDCLAGMYTIPDTLPYDMRLDGEDLYLGPVIAFFVGEGYLSQETMGKWRAYCRNYSGIRGLIYFCTVGGIDTKTKTIRGYYYDPAAEEKEQLQPGLFPYPGAVYRRARIGMDTLRHLHEHLGGRIFNSYIFNKWQMWTVLSDAGFTQTPCTTRLEGPDSLEAMLGLYSSVYLKPETGRFGKGIQKIERTPEGYLIKVKSGAKQYAPDAVAAYPLIKRYKNRGYIIQQAIPMDFAGKPIDFRVILQKDGSQKWTCSGIIAKIGRKGSINTNNISAVDLGRAALCTIFGLSPERAMERENEMVRICVEACLIMERAYGHFGDVGVDVVVDKDLKTWVLEINKSHQHELARYQEKDPEMYNRVVSRPLEYARALAGF